MGIVSQGRLQKNSNVSIVNQNLRTYSKPTVTINFTEIQRNDCITLKAQVVPPNTNIERVSCYAPFWNTAGWRIVSQKLEIESMN